MQMAAAVKTTAASAEATATAVETTTMLVEEGMRRSREVLAEEDIQEVLEAEVVDGDEEFLWELLDTCAFCALQRLGVVENMELSVKSRRDAAHAIKVSAAMAHAGFLSRSAAAVVEALSTEKPSPRGGINQQESIADLRKQIEKLINTIPAKKKVQCRNIIEKNGSSFAISVSPSIAITKASSSSPSNQTPASLAKASSVPIAKKSV